MHDKVDLDFLAREADPVEVRQHEKSGVTLRMLMNHGKRSSASAPVRGKLLSRGERRSPEPVSKKIVLNPEIPS